MTDRTKKPLPLHGRYRAARGVFREHAGEEQRQITEPPVYARALGRRYQVERGRHAPGVELAEAVPAPASAASKPDRTARDGGVRREELDREQPPFRGVCVLAQFRDVEHRHSDSGGHSLLYE